MPEPDLETRRKRAFWRASHRGTKELDIMLGRYAESRLPGMTEATLGAFEALLAQTEPDLQAWLLAGIPVADARLAPLVRDIRSFHGV